MDGKLTVITGATSGVGYSAAIRLAQGGSSLVLVVRNREKATLVRKKMLAFGVKVDVIIANFAILSDVRSAAKQIIAKYDQIDVLINNAGIFRTSREISEQGCEMVFLVNHLAPFLFTRLLLNKMIGSAPSRIIQVNSQGHRFGGLDLDDLNWEKRFYNGYQSYGASKVAQLLTVWRFAELLSDSGVTINAIHPGTVRSNIGMDNGFLYRFFQRHLLWPLIRGAKISGEALYYTAAAPNLQTISGKFFNRTIEENPMPHAVNRELGHKVWQVSETMTGLPELI